ncbi:MAG: cation:proton antiporter, partial [Chitinispirillales bacterium]|nr:cation:proton antiporter [Chitinispirillales bacterium]
MKKRFSVPILLLAAIPIAAFASGSGGEGDDILGKMSMLVLQLGIIVLAARCAGLLFRKLPVPTVLIELTIGIIIGPHLLGAFPLPGFADGLFPLPENSSIPVTQELYGIAIIASIIMLFSAGLETDLALLLRFSFVGLAVGSGGVIASFAAGSLVAMYFFHWEFLDPRVLFLAVMGVSTSMGIIARILSEKRKMDSPEGVTVLASAVVDDTLGIIALTVVTGVVASTAAGAALAADAGPSASAAWVVGKAVLVWLGFTAAGILFASPLAKVIKKFKTVTFISIFALGLALILAGIFEKAGLAMIIGAYIMGLCLSKTDLADTVRDALEVINSFFVPVFFVVMGMLVDLSAVLSKEVLTFGALYSLAMIAAKVFGCGVPTLFFNFNRTGALRIGMSMVPRGEVTFIIAGIGLSSGVLDASLFGAAILMVLACDLISPPLIALVYSSKGKGVKKDFLLRQTVATPIDVASSELTGLLESRVVQAFRAEGFFVHSISIDGRNVYHLRKDEIQI